MLNVIFFPIYYSTITNFPRYGKMWYMNLLIFYSRFSLISLLSSPSATQYSPPPSPLSHTLSFSLFPFDLFSSYLWIWATTDFLSTITDLLHWFFFPLLFTSPSLFYLIVAYQRGSLGCGSLFYLEPLIRCSLFSESPIRCSISEGFIDSPFLWRFHRFVLHLLRTSKFSVFSVILLVFQCLLLFSLSS